MATMDTVSSADDSAVAAFKAAGDESRRAGAESKEYKEWESAENEHSALLFDEDSEGTV